MALRLALRAVTVLIVLCVALLGVVCAWVLLIVRKTDLSSKDFIG